MRFGIASRPARGMSVNGDAYLTKEWNGQTLLAVIDGLGHGEEASIASTKAREYVMADHKGDVEHIMRGLHENLRETRGAVAGLLRVDRVEHRLSFCGIGNVEVTIVGEPQMHPVSLDGIIGVNARKFVKFEYNNKSLRVAAMHSDGISSRFSLSDYPSVCEQPQKVAEQIMAELGNEYDDATILIAVEDERGPTCNVTEVGVSSSAKAQIATEQVKDLAEELGLSEADQAKIATATSELAMNIVVHAHGEGKIIIRPITEGGRVGIMVIAEDSGSGIADVEKALEECRSTVGGLGIGLGAAKRLADEFNIESEIGKGTKVTLKKWKH